MIGGEVKKIRKWIMNEKTRKSSRTEEQIARLEKIAFKYINRRHSM